STRCCATMRSPAASIMALIAPVRLRRVASGLMIEKVRSIAISAFLLRGRTVGIFGLITAASAASKARPWPAAHYSPGAGASRVLPQSPGIVSSPRPPRCRQAERRTSSHCCRRGAGAKCAPSPVWCERPEAGPAPAPLAPGSAQPGGSRPGPGIALEMSECDLVRAAGYTGQVEISRSERGERSVVLTYLQGEHPGIYRFVSGRLKSIERAP